VNVEFIIVVAIVAAVTALPLALIMKVKKKR